MNKHRPNMNNREYLHKANDSKENKSRHILNKSPKLKEKSLKQQMKRRAMKPE